MDLDEFKEIIHRCFRCGYCKFTHNYSDFNCPSFDKYKFESFSTGGRMWLIYALMNKETEWSERVANILYSCPTCGNCMENCRFEKFNTFLVDIIEAARARAVESGFCPERQKTLLERTINPKYYNPYGEPNTNNEDLKQKYNLPNQAEWVYFIGCTSNYRQQDLRDATLKLLKSAGISFTLIDEHCCTSPLIRTGQIEPVEEFMNYNIERIQETGAKKVITSCAGCCRTLKVDFKKQDIKMDIEVLHTSELINHLLKEGKITFDSEINKIITYHDPCHIGRHLGLYDAPREVYNNIPGIDFREMERIKGDSWCCGAGGGVKIGYPDWALEISKERLEQAKKTGAQIISSTCPFCRTNLSDANIKFAMGFEILDLVEILDKIQITAHKK